ncbi:hypothetical protein Tco_0978138 [Tanacetum coccineum]|uniref:Uncharacterized protein n=1 Tax=Tanacetum coccineum TaxID=301880 RepID=A0ABQ5EM15_9ASTR
MEEKENGRDEKTLKKKKMEEKWMRIEENNNGRKRISFYDRDNTRSRPIDEEPNEESGGSTKRSRTSEEGEYVVHSNQETPNSGGSQRPIGRDSAKKKGKGKASQSFSSAEFVEELEQRGSLGKVK